MQNLINISIDDISPHPKSSIKVLDSCFELINVFPDIKFSLFIPISYWRTVKPAIATQNPLQINFFSDFCKVIRSLPDKNFELCYHGFHHGIPGKSDNDEFKNLNYDQAIATFNAMFEVVKLSNLETKFKMIFRPPAWRMSPEAIRAARDVGIEVLALSSKDYAKKTYCNEDNNKNDVVYYNCNPPFDNLKLFKNTEIVYHACEWDNNYFSKEMMNELKAFLKDKKGKYEFSFIKSLISKKD